MILSIVFSVICFCVIFFFQRKYFVGSRNQLKLYQGFFAHTDDYAIYKARDGREWRQQIKAVGGEGSDLNGLIAEVNKYVWKTKGTTDFAVIQNKVERKLAMRLGQATATLTFPTYFGLMGTFVGVMLGIIMFICSFNGDEGGVTDESIRNLLIGVLVSMSTSFVGLFLTTCNNARLGAARKQVEEDKNAFYDFVQTELMPSLDVSMVLAVSKLHETVDRLEPAFNSVIDRFQQTFDTCTKAFGDSFERNVTAVASAVEVMGENMDKINDNISLQKQLIATLRSDEVARGMARYVEAASRFADLTASLDKFEEARRMMLAAAQEAIHLQDQYAEHNQLLQENFEARTLAIQRQFADTLAVPQQVAESVKGILDRITQFEESINRLGGQLNRRELLGNDVVNAIEAQVKSISKKSSIAEDYAEKADGELRDFFNAQAAALDKNNRHYMEVLAQHVDTFEEMLRLQTADLQQRHNEFLHAMEEKLTIAEVHKDFSSLRRLDDIAAQLGKIDDIAAQMTRLPQAGKVDEMSARLDALAKNAVSAQVLAKEMQQVRAELAEMAKRVENAKTTISLFGGRHN